MKAVDFTFDTPFEQGLRLSEEVRKAEYTLLLFLRYFGCRSCQVDMIDLAAAKDAFAAKNTRVLVVLQSRPDIAAEGSRRFELPFGIICDPEGALYRLYGVESAGSAEGMAARNQAADPAAAARMAQKREKYDAYKLAHGEYEGDEYQLPAYFLLNSDMEILRSHHAQSLGDMPTAAEYLQMV